MMFSLFTKKDINMDTENRSATAYLEAKGCGNRYDIGGINSYKGETSSCSILFLF